jgi:Tfp pilus assembly protein PilW
MPRTPQKRAGRATRGLSIAELLAGTALSLMTVGTVFTVQQAQLKAFAVQSTYAQSQTVTRTVIDLMSREARMAGYNPTFPPGALTVTNALSGCPNIQEGVVEATPTKFRFQEDRNADGAISIAGEDITYELVSGDIRRTDAAGAVPVVLADHIPTAGLVFRYFDGSNPPIELVPGGAPAALTVCQRAVVAKVRVTIEADLPNPNPKLASTPVKSIAESEIAIRNRSLANF